MGTPNVKLVPRSFVAACLTASLLGLPTAAGAEESNHVYCGQNFITFRAAAMDSQDPLNTLTLQKQFVHSVLAGAMIILVAGDSSRTLRFPEEDHAAIVTCLD